MSEIPLRRRDGSVRAYAIVDAEDFAVAARYSWSLTGAADPYVHRRLSVAEGGGFITLHRAVLGLRRGDGLKADHINGDHLDCRRSNLRIATSAQNNQNLTRLHRNNTSGYRGVTLQEGRWLARIKVRERLVHLGSYDTPEEAAAAAAAGRAIHMPYSQEAAA